MHLKSISETHCPITTTEITGRVTSITPPPPAITITTRKIEINRDLAGQFPPEVYLRKTLGNNNNRDYRESEINNASTNNNNNEENGRKNSELVGENSPEVY